MISNGIFYNVVRECDREVFHYLLYLEESCPENIISDGKTYIFGQKNSASPVWLYRNDNAPDICELFEGINAKRIITAPEMLGEADKNIRRKLRINIYSGDNISSVSSGLGSVVTASDAHKAELYELIKTMISESTMTDIRLSEAEAFVLNAVNDKNVFLLDDGGIRAMARMAYTSSGFTRFDTIVTEKNSRGRGYVGALLSRLCSSSVSEGKKPVIFADTDYPPSNKAYQKLGLELCGTVNDYILE